MKWKSSTLILNLRSSAQCSVAERRWHRSGPKAVALLKAASKKHLWSLSRRLDIGSEGSGRFDDSRSDRNYDIESESDTFRFFLSSWFRLASKSGRLMLMLVKLKMKIIVIIIEILIISDLVDLRFRGEKWWATGSSGSGCSSSLAANNIYLWTNRSNRWLFLSG